MSLSNWSHGAGALLRQRGYACKQNHAATPRQRLCFRHVAEADGLPVRPTTMAFHAEPCRACSGGWKRVRAYVGSGRGYPNSASDMPGAWHAQENQGQDRTVARAFENKRGGLLLGARFVFWG